MNVHTSILSWPRAAPSVPSRGRHWPLAALCAIAAAALLSACGGSSDAGEATGPEPVDARSSLAFGPCAVTIADPATVCGTLTLAEDRSDPASRLIGLPFAVLPANEASKATDPVVLFTGGPGPSPLRVLAEQPAEQLQQLPVRQRRDVIVMTQRGTDLTLPFSLDCDELNLDFAGGERFASEDAVVEAARACRDRLVRAGAKPGSYTTKAIARDMEDLRVLLGARRGFTQWNLIGSSYGSRLALAVMRDAPWGVRSAVLDGPFPLQERELYGANVLDALTELLAACTRQADCAAAFPGLQGRFAAAIENLQARPQVEGGVTVRGSDVLRVLRAALSVPQPDYANLPLFMDLVARGDIAGADRVMPFLSRLVLSVNTEGMYYTVSCTDDAGLTTATSNELPSNGAGWPDAVRRLIAREGLGPQARTCPLWAAGSRLSTQTLQPLVSNIPALITVGQFDAPTPVSSADLLLRDLRRAKKVVFTGRGHGLLEGDLCMLQVTAAFLDDPARAPDASCVDSADSLRFVTPASAQATARALQAEVETALREQPLIPSLIAQVERPAAALQWAGAAGVIDRDSRAPAAAQTVFRIASVGKTFTAAATYRLAELGRLREDDAIALHLLPATVQALRARGYAPERITVSQLLAHSSGLPNFDSPEYQQAVLADPARRWTRAEQVQFALDRFEKIAEPGEAFAYSDTGYILLGEIIERRTGLGLGAALRELLAFDRLGLRSTWLEADEPAPPLAAGFAHAYSDGGLDLRGIDASTDAYGGGGLVSTVGDLTRFFSALLEGRVISQASLASMQTPFVADIGLGRGIFLLPVGEQLCWGHEGFWGVGVYHCPGSRTSVALTINLAVLDETRRADATLNLSAIAARLLAVALR